MGLGSRVSECLCWVYLQYIYNLKFFTVTNCIEVFSGNIFIRNYKSVLLKCDMKSIRIAKGK
jgi:hypothetical protein